MSDRLALALALSLAAGPAAAGCFAFTGHFEFCPAGTLWEAAEVEQYGDGVAFLAGGYSFDSVEDWAGRDDAANPTLEAALAAVSAWMLEDATVVADHLAGRTETADITAVWAVQGVDFGDGTRQMRATAIAEGGGQRVLLLMAGDLALDPAQVAADFDVLLRTVRPWDGKS